MDVMWVFCLAVCFIKLIHGVKAEQTYKYLLQPMDLIYLGSSDTQYFHIYITSLEDTDVDIVIPGDYYSQQVQLSSTNNKAWKTELVLSGEMLSQAIQHGFRLTASAYINAYGMRFTSATNMYISAYIALPINTDDTSTTVGPYLQGYTGGPYYNMYLIISAWDTTTYYNLYKYHRTSGHPSRYTGGTLEPFDSAYFEYSSSKDYFVGMEVNSSQPVSVFAGNKRTAIPYSSPYHSTSYYSKPLFNQIPSSRNHDKLYVIGPMPGGAGFMPYYSIFITFLHTGTDFTLVYDPNVGNIVTITEYNEYCSLFYGYGNCTITCHESMWQGSYLELRVASSTVPVVLQCSKPCYPMLLKDTDTSTYQSVSGHMSIIAPPKQIPLPLRFIVPRNGGENTVNDAYVIIALDKDIADLTIDGAIYSISHSLTSCTAEHVDKWTVVVCAISYGVHELSHMDPDVAMAVHVHGYSLNIDCSTCYSSSYGFPAYYPIVGYEFTNPASPSVTNVSPKSPLEIAILFFVILVTLGVAAIIVLIFLYARIGNNGNNNRRSMPFIPVSRPPEGATNPGYTGYEVPCNSNQAVDGIEYNNTGAAKSYKPIMAPKPPPVQVIPEALTTDIEYEECDVAIGHQTRPLPTVPKAC